jgi:hypothetical protein
VLRAVAESRGVARFCIKGEQIRFRSHYACFAPLMLAESCASIKPRLTRFGPPLPSHAPLIQGKTFCDSLAMQRRGFSRVSLSFFVSLSLIRPQRAPSRQTQRVGWSASSLMCLSTTGSLSSNRVSYGANIQ